MARAPFSIADRVLLADVGEYVRQKSGLHEGLALGAVQDALVAGCGVELVWIKEGQVVCREYPEPDFFRRPILVWHGVVPRRLHIQLPPEEQKGDTLLTFLRLTDAVRHGLRPASELPQAEQQSEQPQQPPEKRELASVDARASRRRRNSGSGTQRLRARVVLKRLWPKGYPTEEEVSDVDLFDRFAKEYERVEGKANPPSRHRMPSLDTVLREAGRKD